MKRIQEYLTGKLQAPGAANEMMLGCNAAAQLIPYGVYEHRKGIQVLDKAAAQDIVESFNELKKESGFKGLPFYIGHPDVQGFFEKYRDHRAYGWITAVAANDIGLSLMVEWTDAGRSLVANEHFAYWSPLWLLRVAGKDASGRRIIKPFALRSAGLTQEPNIKYLAVACEDYDLAGLPLETETPEEENTMNLFERIKALLNRDDIATEDDAVSVVQKMKDALNAIRQASEARWKAEDAAYEADAAANEADLVTGLIAVLDTRIAAANEDELTTLREQLTAANEALEARPTAEAHQELHDQLTAANEQIEECRGVIAENEVDVAIGAGRIKPADREHWLGRFQADFEAANEELKALPESGGMKTKSASADLADCNADHRSRVDQIVAACNEVMTENGWPNTQANYQKAYLLLRKSKPELF